MSSVQDKLRELAKLQPAGTRVVGDQPAQPTSERKKMGRPRLPDSLATPRALEMRAYRKKKAAK